MQIKWNGWEVKEDDDDDVFDDEEKQGKNSLHSHFTTIEFASLNGF